MDVKINGQKSEEKQELQSLKYLLTTNERRNFPVGKSWHTAP